jgi:hypothetical protein
VLISLHTRPRVQWAPGVSCALCFFEGHELQTSGASRRENAELCSFGLSLRAKRSNPFFLYAARWIASLRSQ